MRIQARRTRHVIYDDSRIPGQVQLEVLGEQATDSRAAGRSIESNDDCNGLVCE